MYLILLTAIAVVCAEPYNRIYLPPAPCGKNSEPTKTLFRTPNFDESFEGVPAGGYTNEFQGVVVDADSPGSSRIAPGVESALGKPRESYGSTISKVGEAAFKTSIGFNERFGPNTRIAPGFETIISGEEGSNDFKVGDAAYKLAPGFNTDDFFKISAEKDGAEKPLAKNDKLSDAGYNSKVEKNQYAFEYQTNAGIKAGENGFNINGKQAESSYSYNGDDGKEYKVAYTADKEGFKSHGGHLSISPTSPLDIVKSIEENRKDEVTGHFDDGSYDEKKYNEGNLEIPSHNSNLHGSTHGAIDTINHSTQFSNNFGKPESNQVNVNNHIVKNLITNQIKNVYKSYKEVIESDLSSINQDSVKVDVTSQSSTRHPSNGLVTQAANTFAQTSTQGMGSQAIKLNLPPKFVNSLSSVSTQNARANEPTNEDNHINYLSTNKRCLGCHYTDPSATFEFPNRNTFFYYLPQNTHDSNIAKIPFKNIGKVQTYSVSIHSTISKSTDINNFVTQTTSINHEENHTTTPTTVSSIKYQSPFTSSASIQPSEEFLGIQDTFKYQTDDATISIVPTIPLSTFTNYQSLLQTQTQFHTMNFGKGTKYLQTFDISKPTPIVALFPTSVPFPATKSFSNNINKSNRYSTSSQFSGQVSSLFLANLLKNLQSETNKNLKPFSGLNSFSNPTISAQNIAGSNKNVLIPVISNESSSSISGSSSQAPSPAPPLNFLIEEENQQLKESFLTGPIVQATAFASSGTSKPQINVINGKYTASTTNPTVVQNIDNSYYYHKPSKPFEIPAISTSGFIKNLQNQETISNTQNLQSQINIKEENMQNVNSFVNTGSLQTSEFEKNIKHTDKADNQELVQSIKPFTGSDSQQEVIMPTKISNQSQFQSIKPVSVPSTSIQNKFGSTQYTFSQNINSTFNIPTSSVVQSEKPQFGQPNFGTQTFKPTFSSTSQSTSAGVQVNTPAKPQVNQTQFVVQPVNEYIGQNAFKSTQNTYGLTQFGSQKFKPSTLQSQQSVPEEKITTLKESGQVNQTQTQVDQVENTLYQSQNKSSSTIQSSVQFVKPQMNFETQKYKPTFVQTPQTGTSLGVAAVKPQLISDKITQTTFGQTENKFGLTQSGAQKFKPSFQSQQSIAELNEYKKPEEISEINKESSTFTGHLVQNTPVSQAIPLQTISTLQKPNISNGTVSISQSNSQLVKPQLPIQNNFKYQTSKPLFGQSTQTNAASLSSQTIQTTKPQVKQTQFISQPPKVNFGQTSFGSTNSAFSQSTFGATQKKFGLTQSGAQKFKPSSFQTQQSAGELYEYKKPEETGLPNKETSAGQIVQVEQTESVTSLTQSVQNKPPSIFESSSQFVKPQINFSTQTSKPILSHSSQTSTTSVNGQTIHTSKPQVTQTQFISQPPKVNFEQTSFGSTNSAFSQSTFGTTQNKFGLTQSGAQKFKPSYFQTHQSTGELYEYKKPEKTGLPNKETSAGQIVQVEQTENITSLTQSAQKQPFSNFQSSNQFVKPQINFSTQTSKPILSHFSQISTAPVSGQTIHTLKPQVTQTQFISQPPKVNIGQTSFGSTNSAFSQTLFGSTNNNFGQSTFGTNQNKFGLTQSGAQKFKPSSFQTQQSAGELYEYKKPEETRFPNKETSAGQIVQVEQTESAASLTQSAQNQPFSNFQSSNQFVKPQFNFSTQTSKPVFSQSSQTSPAPVIDQTIQTSKPQLTQTQFVSQPPKINFGQTSFGSNNSAFSQSTLVTTQNKFGLTQSGAQKLKPSSFQTQQFAGELYEYKKPEDTKITNKETTVGQIFQVEQTESVTSLTQSAQKKPSYNFHNSTQFVNPQFNFSTQASKPVFSQSAQTNIASLNSLTPKPQFTQTQIVSHEISQFQNVPASTFQTGSQFIKPQIIQTSTVTQTSKPTSVQSIQTNKESINSQTNKGTQFVITSTKPQISQTLSVSQPSTFEQTLFSNTQNKFGLTQSSTQKFKPSVVQTEQTIGELYEYKSPEVHIVDKGKDEGQISQIKVEQTESITSLSQNIPNVPISQSQSNTQFVKPSTSSGIQIGVVSTKPQIGQTSFASQPAKAISEPTTFGNTKKTFGQTKLDSTQDKFGLTQFGALTFKPSNTQSQQTVSEYEYDKPSEVFTTTKGAQQTVINTATAQTHVGTQSVPTLSFNTNSQQSITTQSFKPEQVHTHTVESHKVQENLTSPIVLNKEIITKAEINRQNQDVPKIVASTLAQNQQHSGELYSYPKPSTNILIDSDTLIKNEQTSRFSQISTSDEGKKVATVVQHPPTYQNSQFLNTENTKAYTTQSQLNIPQNNPSFVSTNSKAQLNLDKHKEENDHTTSHIHTGSQSTKPVIGHTILGTKFGQTQFGLNPNLQIKPELSSAVENDTTVNSKTSQLTQNNRYINQDTKVGLAQITSQSQSLGTQMVPNTLKITSTKPVNQIQINNAGYPSLQKTESINSQTVIGIQPAKSIPCQTSLTEENYESSLHATEEVINHSTPSNIPPVNHHDSYFLNTQTVSPSGYQKPQIDYEQIHNNHYPYFYHHHDHPHHHGYSHHNDNYYSHEFPHHHDYHHHHNRGPESFGFHNHEFGYRQNKPNSHFDYGFPGKNQFPQNSFPFGQHGTGFYHKNNSPNTFGSSFNSAVATASTGAPEIKNQFYTNPTQILTIHQTKQPFSSTLTTNEFTNTYKESSIAPQPTKPVFINSVPGENQISVEPTKPTILSIGTKTENLSSLNNESTQTIDAQVASANIQSSKSIVSTQPSVLFEKPAAHKFGNLFGSNTAATADIIPSLDSKDKSSAIAQVSSQPNIVQIEGAKNISPFSSNAVAMAQSGNGFRQSSFANAIATTGPLLSQFDVHRGSLQSYSSFDGHSSNIPIASGPQLLASSSKGTFGTPSFSNAFASASKDSSFASSFVSSIPITTVVYDRSITSLSDISTIKPGLTSRVSGKGETFDGPRDPPKFDGLTGYHY